MTLFLTPEQLKAFTPISSSIEVEFLNPFLSTTQSMYVTPILGLALSTQIENEIANQTISGANQVLLFNYVMPYMAFKTFEQAVPFLSMKAYKRSLAKPAGVDTTPLTLDELKYYRQNINDMADHYGQSMIDMLADDESNGSPLYPLYRVIGKNERKTMAVGGSMYFRRKVTAGAQSAIQSFPSNWFWNFTGWNY